MKDTYGDIAKIKRACQNNSIHELSKEELFFLLDQKRQLSRPYENCHKYADAALAVLAKEHGKSSDECLTLALEFDKKSIGRRYFLNKAVEIVNPDPKVGITELVAIYPHWPDHEATGGREKTIRKALAICRRLSDLKPFIDVVIKTLPKSTNHEKSSRM